jgi:hypothetical protein
MFAYEYLLAAALLTAPMESPEPAVPENFNSVCHALQTLAIQWEILDPREVRYVLTRTEDFASDLKLLRRRYHELDGAPLLSDSCRFPERSAISDMLSFNRAYRQNLDNRLSVEVVRVWELQEALQETDHLYQVWDLVRDARCDYYYVTVRRQALKRLRDMVGGNVYYSGTLPPHVPLWRFQTVE